MYKQPQYLQSTPLLTKSQQNFVQNGLSQGQKGQLTRIANYYNKQIEDLQQQRQTKQNLQKQAYILQQQQQALQNYVQKKKKEMLKLQQQQDFEF
jgi:hypothetical protein